MRVIQQRMDVTRKFRHDLLSHVQTLEYLIEKQKDPDQELRKYADQLTEDIPENTERNLLPG